MRYPRALPSIQLMPAAGSRQCPDATTGGRPGKNERPRLSPGTPHRPSRRRTPSGSAHPDKAGRWRALASEAHPPLSTIDYPQETAMT